MSEPRRSRRAGSRAMKPHVYRAKGRWWLTNVTWDLVNFDVGRRENWRKLNAWIQRLNREHA